MSQRDLMAILIRLGEMRMIEMFENPNFEQAIRAFKSELVKKRAKDMTEEEIEQKLRTNPVPGLNLAPLG